MDEARREFARAFLVGDEGLQARFIADALRSGELDRAHVEVAASLGHRSAAEVLGRFSLAMSDWPHEAQIRFCLTLIAPARDFLFELEDSLRWPEGSLAAARSLAEVGIPHLERLALRRQTDDSLEALRGLAGPPEGSRSVANLLNGVMTTLNFVRNPSLEDRAAHEATPNEVVELFLAALQIVSGSYRTALLQPDSCSDAEDLASDRGRALWTVERSARTLLGRPQETVGQRVSLCPAGPPPRLSIWQERGGGEQRVNYLVAEELIPWALGIEDRVRLRHERR